MLFKITNALGREASERQVDAINLNCDHIDVWRVKDSRLFDVSSAEGAADLKRIALEFGLFAEITKE